MLDLIKVGSTAVVVCCTLLVAATPASATPGDDATIVAASYDAASADAPPSGRVTTKSVTCPAGQRVVGGGNGPAGVVNPFYLSLPLSSPLDEGGTAAGTNTGEIARIWSASVKNVYPTPLTPYPERVFANCSANSDAVIEATTGSLNSLATGTFMSTCPAGSRAVGGGFASLSGSTNFLQRESNPVDETGLTGETFTNEIARSWSVTVTNGGGSTAAFSVFALCSQASDATLVVDSFLAAATGESAVTVDCPAGKRVLGGGIGTDTAFGPYLTASAPVSAAGTTAATNTGDIARGWLGSAFNSGGPTARYEVFALCASDPGTGPGPDTTPPATSIDKHPKKSGKKRKATFSFSSSESGGSFECKLDKGAFAPCTSPFKKKVKAGRKPKVHHFSVVAIDAAGNRDATPATYAWKVKKKPK